MTILDKPRTLTNEENKKIYNAQQKWYPKLFQTYNTTLYEMMANPLKKTFINFIFFTIILLIIILTVRKFNLGNAINYLIGGGIIFLLISSILTYKNQYKKNENLKLILTLTNPGATKYDYESSNVIQGKLMRNSVSSRSSSGLGGFLGGLIGSSLSFLRKR